MDNDDARFWIDHGLDGLQCLRATYVKHRFSPHVHGEFAIGVIERGAQRVRCRGGHEIMPERTVCVINPFETHTGQAATQAGWSYRMVYPGPGLMHRLSNQLHGRDRGVPRFAGLVIRDTWLMERFQTLHVVLEEGRSSTLARESLLLSFLAALISRHSQEHASPRRLAACEGPVRQAAEHLRENCTREVRLERLAELAGLSQYHFMRSFKRVMGVSAHAFQLHWRIEEAKRLLAGGAPIAQAATEAGFVDQSHLTHRFRATVGVTPGQFRLKSRIVQDPSG